MAAAALREHVLALDLGTSSVRALVLAADGRVRGRASQALPTRYPAPGRVEQDPEAWWTASRSVMDEALAEARLDAGDLAALGIVTQRATALAWDARSGRPLAPALGWQDTRTGPRAQELAARGIAVSSMASATKFEWLLAHEPTLREAARAGRLRLGTPDAWLGERLGGGACFATDPGQASCTGLYDLAGARWHPAGLSAFGLEPAWLPALAPTSAVLAETPAALLGSPVPVAARAGDQQAASFAQGMLGAGAGKLTLGTSAMLDVHTGAVPARPPRGAFPLALWWLGGDTRAFCVEGTVVTAGAALAWLVDLGLARSAAHAESLAASVPDAAGVQFVPALQGLGTPRLDPGARAAWLGLTRGASRAHLARAVIEGVAQRCADLCEALPLADGPLRVDGGLARSRMLVRTLADLSGRVVLRAAETETTALGAAYLAGLAVGLWRDAAEACATAAPAEPFEPGLDPEARAETRSRWRAALARVR